MMRKVWILTGAALFSSVALLSAQDVPGAEQYTVRLEGAIWGPSLASELQVTGNVQGTLIDVPKDLAVADKGTYEGRLTLQLGVGHKVRLGYTKIDYDGNTQINREIRFQDTVYPRFTRLVTSLKGSYFSGEYQWDIFKGSRGYFGPLVGAKFFDLDAALVAPERGDRDLQTLRVPVPVVGVAGRGYYGRFSFSGEAGGFTIGKKANLIEFAMGTHFNVSDHLGVQFGYRFMRIHGEYSNDLVTMRLSGLKFGGEISF
jgi:hypothetical protein